MCGEGGGESYKGHTIYKNDQENGYRHMDEVDVMTSDLSPKNSFHQTNHTLKLYLIVTYITIFDDVL